MVGAALEGGVSAIRSQGLIGFSRHRQQQNFRSLCLEFLFVPDSEKQLEGFKLDHHWPAEPDHLFISAEKRNLNTAGRIPGFMHSVHWKIDQGKHLRFDVNYP